MSIISDALNKVSDKRIDYIRLREERIKRDLSTDIEKIALKKRRWSFSAIVGTLFIVGFSVLLFLYYIESLPSSIYPKSTSFNTPERPALKIETPKDSVTESAPSFFSTISLKEKKEVLPALTLNGIIGGRGEPLAIINNMVLRKGDFIQGAQLLEIYTDRVELISGDKEITLRIE